MILSLQEAYKAIQDGNLQEAQRLADQLLAQNPNDIDALLVKLGVSQTVDETQAIAARILDIDPNNAHALAFIQPTNAPVVPTSPAPMTVAANLESSNSPVPKIERPASKKAATKKAGDLGTYQMLWDCEFCGTKGLLGLTHRFCPNCGSQQNPDKRYFPSDDEKVLVEDHEFFGADVICPSCDTLNSAKGEFCVQCGTPLSEGAKAKALDEQVKALGAKFAAGSARDLVKDKFDSEMQRVGATPKAGKKRSPYVIGCAILAALALFACCGFSLYAIFATKQESVTVVDHSWRHEVEILQFQSVRGDDWENRVPNTAYNVSCSRKQSGTRQIPDGETCSVRRIDNGDGTFSERQECQTTYRSEAVYDDYCSYTVDRWESGRTAISSGDSLGIVSWPELSLAPGQSLAAGGSGTRIGAEKEGERRQVYVVTLRDSNGETYECEFDSETRWREFSTESRWDLKIGAVTGAPDCDSLKPVN